jgi:hypothetical protein
MSTKGGLQVRWMVVPQEFMEKGQRESAANEGFFIKQLS